MIQIATIKAIGVFQNLNKKIPQETIVTFKLKHPCYKDINVFIGGEIPYWVKKFVNHL